MAEPIRLWMLLRGWDMWHWNRRGSYGAVAASLALVVSGVAAQGAAPSRASVSLLRSLATAEPKCPPGGGISVAIAGSIALVGNTDANNYRGAACVYTRQAGTWHVTGVLLDPGNKYGDGFGYSVAVSSTNSGTYAVISAGGDGNFPGVVYIYVRSGGTWRLQARLPDPGKGMTDNFGQSVAVSGATAVIGADYSVANYPGLVYVYVKAGSSWHLQEKLTDPTKTPSFGSDVAISGSTIIVGDGEQPSPSERSRLRAAAVPAASSVCTRTGSKWHLQATLTSGDPAAVAISGNVALVGEESLGDAQLFARTGTTWRRLTVLHGPFGNSVALAGSAAVIGAPYGYGDAAAACGAVYVYEGSGTKWKLRVVLVPPHCPPDTLELFGWSVAASGETAVIGSGYGGAYVMNFP